MTSKREKEYQKQLELAHKMIDVAYEQGRTEERKNWAGYIQPETMAITMSVRGKNGELKSIRNIATFEMIKHGRVRMMQLLIEEMFLKIAAGKIIKKLIES